MSDAGADALRIRTLLLGDASAAEREHLEGRLIAEEELFELAASIEDDLAGAYVANTMPAGERRAFERQLALVPRLRERVEAARVLDAAVRRRASPERRPRRAFFEMRLPAAWRWSLASALTVALAAGALTRSRVRELEGRAARLEAERDLARAPAFVLAPGAVRGGGGPARVRLGSGTRDLDLRLDLEAPLPGPFRAALRAPSGAEVFAVDGLPRRDAAGAPGVELTVPAEVLAPGDYEVFLETGSGGDRAAAGTYLFRVEAAP